MLQQSSQQRIGGGAHARVHSRTSSKASSATDDARRAGLELNLPQTGIKTEPDSLKQPYGSNEVSVDIDSRTEWSQAGSADELAHQSAPVAIPPVGFPPRPAQYAKDRNTSLWSADTRNENMSSADGRAQNFEPPQVSLVYPQSKCADYNPWIGNGSEDTLSEQTVKSGFLNKPTITNESNTARPSIWNPLKHKSGLQTLSSLFVAILEKRQGSGRLVASSTFKPPPRVSLTNTKREAWLSDLANPACALRRFNRTIPYGINGKGLLEQCLAKEIPTARAIWLTKCIGANELRTLRRKGVAGAPGINAELKWVREWTMHVEQFLDATVSARSDQSWKEKVQYVVRLTYHFYIEQLLDQDHFLDWIMSSFESSGMERLPLWLVHLQLYWRFLVCTRKRGRRLGEAICASLHQIEADRENADLLAPISQRLGLLLGTLASSHTACLVMPKSWAKFEAVVRNHSSRADSGPAIASIVERNNRLAKPLWEQNPRTTVSPKRRAFSVLDNFDPDVSIPDICASLYELLSSIDEVIKLVLEWCSSSYRQGAYRVYLTSRILRRFGLSGADIESCILGFLMDPPAYSNIDVRNVIKVVAELVRAKSFAVLKVLRTVIARGAMTDSEHNPQAASRLRQLVRGIPTAGLPQHVGDLQRNLLREDSQPGLSRLEPVVVLKKLIEQNFSRRTDFKWTQNEEELVSSLSIAERFEISSYLRLELLRISKPSFEAGADTQSPRLTCRMFHASRELFEKFEDFPLLADVVGLCLRQRDGDMLASAIDTIHFHVRTFAAIGALRPLTAQAIERYHVFRNEMPLEKVYIAALMGLLNSISGEPALVQQLAYDLARCDQRNALAMCSPASDNALDLVTSSSLESEEEIERILTSGTTMDEQSVNRVFQRITRHLTTPSKTRTKAEWFSRLRAFDEATFDALMNTWLTDLLQIATEDICCEILPLLLGTGATSFQSVAQIEQNVRELPDISVDTRIKLTLVMITIFLLPTSDTSRENLNERYKFRLAQTDFASQHLDIVLKTLGWAFGTLDETSISPKMEALDNLLRNPAVRSFLLGCALNHKKPLQEHIMVTFSSQKDVQAGTRLFKEIIEGHLDQPGQPSGDLPNQDKIPRLVRMVGELSLPLCQLEMQLLLNGEAKASEGSVEMASSLFEAILRSPDSERPPWLDLIDGLDAALLQRLRAIAELQVLKIVNEYSPRAKVDGAEIDHPLLVRVKSALRRLLYVVDCSIVSPTPTISASQPTPGDSELPAIDRFGAIREILMKHFVSDLESKPTNRTACELTCCLLNGLLHLLVVRKLSSEGQRIASADVASLLPILLFILAQSGVGASRSTTELLYDAAAYISDDLSDEYRSVLVRSEMPKYPNDPRIAFILGPPPSTDAWLGLVTTNQIPPPPPSSNNPASMASQTPAARFGTPPQGNARFQQPVRPPTPQRPGNTPSALQKSYNPPVAFPLRRWELLPDQGSNTTANDTAISLSLVGARKV